MNVDKPRYIPVALAIIPLLSSGYYVAKQVHPSPILASLGVLFFATVTSTILCRIAYQATSQNLLQPNRFRILCGVIVVITAAVLLTAYFGATILFVAPVSSLVFSLSLGYILYELSKKIPLEEPQQPFHPQPVRQSVFSQFIGALPLIGTKLKRHRPEPYKLFGTYLLEQMKEAKRDLLDGSPLYRRYDPSDSFTLDQPMSAVIRIGLYNTLAKGFEQAGVLRFGNYTFASDHFQGGLKLKELYAMLKALDDTAWRKVLTLRLSHASDATLKDAVRDAPQDATKELAVTELFNALENAERFILTHLISNNKISAADRIPFNEVLN